MTNAALPNDNLHYLRHHFFQAIGLKRAHLSLTEAAYAATLAQQLKPTLIDGAGNLHFDHRKGVSKTLFTAHTDTVHREGGANFYKLEGDAQFVQAEGAVLGSDDASGIAIMCHMMSQNVPGYYIFFRGEEVGGIGSSFLAKTHPTLLEGFDRAVAFDRAGYDSVITHQAGGRCCSDAFAEALACALNFTGKGFAYKPDSTGVYTDTAEFIDLIPECTNLSVGYFGQHTDQECQDMDFLGQLAQACVDLDWESLPTKRDPSEMDDWPKQVFGTSWEGDDFEVYDADIEEFEQALYDLYDGHGAAMRDLFQHKFGVDYTPTNALTYEELQDLLQVADEDLEAACALLFEKSSV